MLRALSGWGLPVLASERRKWMAPICNAYGFTTIQGGVMLQLMLNTVLFRGIPEEKVREISAFSQIVNCREGAQAIVEGKDGEHQDILLLVEGEVNVGTRFSPLPNAMEFDLHAIGNEMLGEVAWVLGRKRSANVTCKKHCMFIQINGSKLFEYCQANPAVGVELMTRVAAVLAQRVVHLSEQLRNRDLFS